MAYASWSVAFGEQPSATKWNILGTNDAHFYDFLGDNLAWQTFSPSLTNLSGGTMNYCQYTKIGKTVFVRLKYTLAGAGVGGAVAIGLPVTATSNYASSDNGETLQGSVGLIDATTTYWIGAVLSLTTTTVRIRALNGSSNLVALSSTVPFTWGSGDFLSVAFQYEAA
jgi:hypothetical protein